MDKKLAAIFKNKDGRVVIWQMPNFLLWWWIILRVVMVIVGHGNLQTAFEQLSNAVLFAWAYLEITKGITTFRRLLGGTVMVLLVASFFWK